MDSDIQRDPWRFPRDVLEIRGQIVPFVEKAKVLLARERRFMQTTPLSPPECPDTGISRLRQELFVSAMSHGERFKQLIDIVDRPLFTLIRKA